MSWRTRVRVLGVSFMVVGALAIAGAANTYWSAASGGSGSTTTGTAADVTLGPRTPVSGLYPGGTADVVLRVSNPNTSPVRLGSLALDTARGTGGFAVDAGHSGCAVSTLSLSTQTNGGAGWTVPARSGAVNGTLPLTVPNSLAMGLGAASACQGATFTVYLAAGP